MRLYFVSASPVFSAMTPLEAIANTYRPAIVTDRRNFKGQYA